MQIQFCLKSETGENSVFRVNNYHLRNNLTFKIISPRPPTETPKPIFRMNILFEKIKIKRNNVIKLFGLDQFDLS